ncbi:chaperone modulator CbpM [Rhizobium herbae]|uniref:Chaperone modulatory protein CbpM n=1 Tax=Rhizobium herbae TaxID=508661 RepID=A0ABS4EG49_9HYPH|nr:chaperone modulator CbpM [Rhizobium herbae]MBP1856922.1 chaperone modulatory protein CbpM [Rhizobium herbae]
MNHLEYCERLSIVSSTLTVWIDRQWIIPEMNDDDSEFQDADLARGLLILDLTETMGVNHDGIDVIMALVDQVHGLRAKLQALTDAIREQDDEIAQRVVKRLEAMR